MNAATFSVLAGVCLMLTGCATMSESVREARAQMAKTIAAEPHGDYFVGRRYFREGYKFWGYVRRPGESWDTAQLVILNEKQKLAPDREQLNIGADNNYEYRLGGRFSGDRVYELLSNRVYPEFVLTRYELLSADPTPIFRSQFSGGPGNSRIVEEPE